MVSSNSILILAVVVAILAAQVSSKYTQRNLCGRNRQPLANVFCGRGPARQDCPVGYKCNIAPNDSYAVCCPTRVQRTTNRAPSKKPGSCPPPSTGAGICVVKCNDDFNCPRNQKCCGSCPRQCVSLV